MTKSNGLILANVVSNFKDCSLSLKVIKYLGVHLHGKLILLVKNWHKLLNNFLVFCSEDSNLDLSSLSSSKMLEVTSEFKPLFEI